MPQLSRSCEMAFRTFPRICGWLSMIDIFLLKMPRDYDEEFSEGMERLGVDQTQTHKPYGIGMASNGLNGVFPQGVMVTNSSMDRDALLPSEVTISVYSQGSKVFRGA